MTNQPKRSATKLSVILVLGLILQAEAMHYQEPLHIEDLKNLFGEDGCIDGTLSSIETGGANPLFKSISFTDEVSLTLASKKNTTEVLDEKSPMSSVNELADFNKIKVKYILIKEEGPSHKKHFGISLELGSEQYYGEGNSIKQAQREASRFALNSTKYEHPPKKPKPNKVPKYNTSPVEKLNDWAMKHNHATVRYSFIEQSKIGSISNHANVYHKDMYSRSQNVHKVSVKVGNEQFEGEGPSLDIAKQQAARNALQKLQNAEGFCMFDSETQNLFTKIFNPGSEESEISLVFEFASKSKMKASFELASEEGPAHIKRFVYKSTVGDDFETFGEGSNKKTAKKEAAENMLRKLKSHFQHHPVNCGSVLKKKKKSRKNRSKNLIKSVVKSEFEEEENLEHFVPDTIDPISKLIQIQQSKHEVPPVFTFLKDKDKSQLNKFFIEVTVGDLSFVGSGPNKKAAKRNAAEGMLEKLGYATVSGKTRMHTSEQKKKAFIEDHTTVKKKQLVPGINLNSNKFVKLDDDSPPLNSEKPKDPKLKEIKVESKDITAKSPDMKSKAKYKSKEKEQNDQKQPSHSKPKAQLASMAQQLGLRFQFSDFPKADKSGFVSLLSLTTDPPRVCYGLGQTTDQSQDFASLTALESLYKSEMHMISQMLRKQNSEISEEDTNLLAETKTVVNLIKTSYVKETE